MQDTAALVADFEAGLEAVFRREGVSFEREEPGYSPGPRWYIKYQRFVVMITLDDGASVAGPPTLSICLQTFVLDPADGVDDLFTLLAHCAPLINLSLIGAETADGTRVLMLQRRVRLSEIQHERILLFVEDVIGQYEAILANPNDQEQPRLDS